MECVTQSSSVITGAIYAIWYMFNLGLFKTIQYTCESCVSESSGKVTIELFK